MGGVNNNLYTPHSGIEKLTDKINVSVFVIGVMTVNDENIRITIISELILFY